MGYYYGQNTTTCSLETKWENQNLLLLFGSPAAFDSLDLLGAEDQHAVLEAAHLTRGGFSSRGGRGQLFPLVPCGVEK